jgi:hypothetical protein
MHAMHSSRLNGFPWRTSRMQGTGNICSLSSGAHYDVELTAWYLWTVFRYSSCLPVHEAKHGKKKHRRSQSCISASVDESGRWEM